MIDLIYPNYPDRVVCSGVSHCRYNYHNVIYVYRKLAINIISYLTTTVYYLLKPKKFMRQKFRNDISYQGRNHNLSNSEVDPNIMWAKWVNF